MIDMRRRVIVNVTGASIVTGVGLGGSLGLVHAQSESWPGQSIKIVVPFATGGAIDVLARPLAERLSIALKQAVAVDNRPGSDGTVGAAHVAQAKPDGYTLLVATTSQMIAPALHKNLPYDALNSFSPVVRLSSSGFAMVMHTSVAAVTVNEFVTLAKAQPGKFQFGFAGVGGVQHLVSQMFFNSTGIDAKHVPYRGYSQVVSDLISGRIQMSFMPLILALQLSAAGNMRIMAVTTGKRAPEMPGVPTMIEVGFPDFVATNWVALVAPQGTPLAVVARLNVEVQQVMTEPALKKRLLDVGLHVDLAGPDELGPFMRDESAKWLQLAKSVNLPT